MPRIPNGAGATNRHLVIAAALANVALFASADDLMSQLPLPGCTLRETAALRKIVEWHAQIQAERRRTEEAGHGRHVEPLTTKLLTQRLKLKHGETMKLLDRLQQLGFTRRRRRLSGGRTGYGYDGSLYSEVEVSPTAAQALAEHDAAMQRLFAGKG